MHSRKLIWIAALSLALFVGIPLSAQAATPAASSKAPTTISRSITMTVTKKTTYQTPKKYRTTAGTHVAIYRAHFAKSAKQVTFKLTGFAKTNTSYQITKKMNTQGLNWYYLKGHGWIIGGTHRS